MRDALECIHHWAGKVVRGVGLVLEAMLVVGRVCLAAVEDGIAQTLVGALHVHLPSDAHLQPFLRAFEHLPKSPEILLHLLVSAFAADTLVPLIPHRVDICVVHVCLPLFDELLHGCLQLFEVVGRVADHVRLDLQGGKVLDHALLELHLLLARVRVVEAHNELALVVPGIVVVEHCGLGMPDMKVAAWLRRKPRAHLAHLGSRQEAFQLGLVLALLALVALLGASPSSLAGSFGPLLVGQLLLQRSHMHEPASGMWVLLSINVVWCLRQAVEVLGGCRNATAYVAHMSQMIVELLESGFRLEACEGHCCHAAAQK
mmetsp:Transcript_122807/g.292126  ORF Transcript_122807/g.292126 Transcript_122807/m.292126 type:complete len:316 (+) Transcript_122807:1790-2737(+)